ncbi:ATPase family associated with various cellular activities (AAA) [Halovenus aranensis]|uniref:ATPase family associated with various cellular activities (AAA) n=1 Tax=Halovenus aranensis TaxID=890420 RepID=A0A1G8ZJJ6_9EURY|nr:ATP-binding protein [Halovenus aranensis]SDK15256.1 ATPase family associated with various cellular activities (AAA) [Halovenus aranensis]
MSIYGAIGVVVAAVVGAWWLIYSPSPTPGEPKTVKDSVPESLQGGAPTLEERRRRAEARRVSSDGGDSEGGRSDESEAGDVLDGINTGFDWETDGDVSFDDVGGMDDVIKQLRRDVVIPVLDEWGAAEELGVIPPNVLLEGLPGTGKTHVATALATELGVPFAPISGSDLQSKSINASPQNVSRMFSEAERVAEAAGGAVLFIDEVDSVLSARGVGNSHREDSKVVAEFLNNLEVTGESGVVVVAATNRVDQLDSAGVRAGRFDVSIHVGLPGKSDRAEILRTQLRNRRSAVSSECVRDVAACTKDWSAAETEIHVSEPLTPNTQTAMRTIL